MAAHTLDMNTKRMARPAVLTLIGIILLIAPLLVNVALIAGGDYRAFDGRGILMVGAAITGLWILSTGKKGDSDGDH